MLTLSSILVLVCSSSYVTLSEVTDPKIPNKVFYQLNDINVLFKEFIDKYDKNYGSAEYERRIKVFEDNLVEINRLNREQSNGVYGIGPFTDLTFEEFKTAYTESVGNFTNENTIKYKPTRRAPDSLDWRQENLVTRVKNQLNCNSSYIFATTGSIEGQQAKYFNKLIEVSEQQLLDCASNGCKGGLPHEVIISFLDKGMGCMTEADYPYKGQKGQCHNDPSKLKVRVLGGYSIEVKNEIGLKNPLFDFGPLVVGMQLDKQMQHWKGGVFKPSSCNDGTHYMLVVGYGKDNDTPYWILKSSWGEHWSEQGYLRLVIGQRACDIGSYVFTASVIPTK